jgi:putative proteasome-type protease
MTYCLAIAVDDGLVFASDSRTNAGVDNVATYGKMHTFGIEGDRQFVVLTSGNLATSQAVVANMKQDIKNGEETSLFTVASMGEAAEYLGRVLRGQQEKHAEAVAQAGFSPEATFIIGGQVGDRSPKLYMVYPQGNFITTSLQTPFLQIGESKYGKAILDRIIHSDTALEEAARCALVSIDSTMRSNASVGPPVEILCYENDSLRLDKYLNLTEDDPYLLEVKRAWNQNITAAFDALPRFEWDALPQRPRFE